MSGNLINNDISEITRAKILDRIDLLRADLENTFIANNLTTDTQVINLSQELDEAIIEYHTLFETQKGWDKKWKSVLLKRQKVILRKTEKMHL
jgi:hypothetical protein